MKKILLIEDNRDIRENTAEILQLANYKVYTADNGKTGVELAIREKPDLIICDIMMPVLDGYGVLSLIHKNEEIRNTPFIFLSAKTERDEIRKGMALGADDYITKPFEGTELLEAVEGRIQKADVLRKEIAERLNGSHELIHTNNGQNLFNTLTQNRNTNKYKKKQIIFWEGNRPSCLYYIQKGKVKTYKSNDDGKELIVDLYGEGDFVGYAALLEEMPYKASAMAIEDTEIAIIPKSDFDELMNSSKEVAQKFLRLLAKNVTAKEEQLLGMAYNSLRKKIADALISLQNKYNPSRKEDFAIDISRENIATMAGTATESLIRTLSDFKTEKLIDLRKGKIVVTDEARLRKMFK